MSNRIIVKGADFSANGIADVGVDLEPILGINVSLCTKASNKDSNFYFPEPAWNIPLVKGRKIYAIRVRVASGSSFEVIKLEGYTGNPALSSQNTGTITTIQRFTNGVAGQVKDYFFDEPFEIPNDGNVCIGLRHVNSSEIGFLSASAPYLFYVANTGGSWLRTTNYGGGFELLAEVV